MTIEEKVITNYNELTGGDIVKFSYKMNSCIKEPFYLGLFCRHSYDNKLVILTFEIREEKLHNLQLNEVESQRLEKLVKKKHISLEQWKDLLEKYDK